MLLMLWSAPSISQTKNPGIDPGFLRRLRELEVESQCGADLSTTRQGDTKTSRDDRARTNIGAGPGKETAAVRRRIKGRRDHSTGRSRPAHKGLRVDVTKDVHGRVIVGQVLAPNSHLPAIRAVACLRTDYCATTRLGQIVDLSKLGALVANVTTDVPLARTHGNPEHRAQ